MAIFPIEKPPLLIPGLRGWFRADDVADGAVATWSDIESGSRISATQGTGANQPESQSNVQGGHKGILFSGGTDAISTPSGGDLADIFATGGVIAGIINIASVGGGGFGRIVERGNVTILMALSNLGSACNLRFSQTSSGTQYIFDSTSKIINFNQSGIFILKYDKSNPDTTPTVYYNTLSPIGMTKVQGNGTALSDSGARYYFGNNSSLARQLDGYIFELLFYKRTTTTAEDQALMRYLANKYGIAVT